VLLLQSPCVHGSQPLLNARHEQDRHLGSAELAFNRKTPWMQDPDSFDVCLAGSFCIATLSLVNGFHMILVKFSADSPIQQLHLETGTPQGLQPGILNLGDSLEAGQTINSSTGDCSALLQEAEK